jgi:hypothetical protein
MQFPGISARELHILLKLIFSLGRLIWPRHGSLINFTAFGQQPGLSQLAIPF